MSDFAPHTLTNNYDSTRAITVSASSFFSGSFAPYKAFDGSIGSGQYWVGTGSGTDWLQLDTGIGNTWTLTSYQIQVNSIGEPARAPKNWTMQGSNDGSSWTTLNTQTNQTSWATSETRTFTVTGASAYRYFRLNITANNGDASYTQIAELYLLGTNVTSAVQFAPKNMTSNSAPSPLVASSSSQFSSNAAYEAFDGVDGSPSSRWMGTGSGTDWFQVDLGSGVAYKLLGYTVNISAAEPVRAPKNWTMQGSNDGSSWTTVDTVTNATSWSGTIDTLSFTCAVATTAYRYFRVNITANNGDATYTQVSELYLYGTAGGGGGSSAIRINFGMDGGMRPQMKGGMNG